MPEKVKDVMTADPLTVTADSMLIDAARKMRDADIGPVVVTNGDGVCGIVTDRDITVRAVAEGKDPSTTRVDEVCSRDIATVAPDDDASKAVDIMRSRAIRRLPVLDGGKPVGIVSLGDLAIERDSDSALADISEAPPNN